MSWKLSPQVPPIAATRWLPRRVARARATIHTKLQAAFFTVVVLFVALGAVGLHILEGYKDRAAELLMLERRIAAYRQLQHNIAEQLYAVTKTLVSPHNPGIGKTLLLLDRFAYDFERAQFVSEEHGEVLDQIKVEYAELIATSTEVLEAVNVGNTEKGIELTIVRAGPLAERLERHINSLVNRTEVEMVTQIDASNRAYEVSRYVVIGVALGSVALALVLGYAISWSVIEPVRQMDARFKEIAHGDFQGRLEVANRDELGDLAEEVNSMCEELERLYVELETASRHKSEFLANMSHELRTPMNAIIGFNRLVMRRCKDILPEKQYQNLEKIAVSADHLLTLINSVLDLSKIEAGRMEVRAAEFQLPPLLEACVRTVEPILNGKDVRLSSQIEGPLPVMCSDQDKIRQILINFLSNAVKFTERGTVAVTAREEGGNMLVSVSDTGVGMPAEKLQTVFESFTQLDSGTTRQHPGTGLGLAISRHLARLVGGDIVVQSTAGEGSTFEMVVPVRIAASREPETAATAEVS